MGSLLRRYVLVFFSISTILCLSQETHVESNTRFTRTSAESDVDGDGIPDAIDNCKYVDNKDQAESNPSNPEGDACDCTKELAGKNNAHHWQILEQSVTLRHISASAYQQIRENPLAFNGDQGQSKVYRSSILKEYCQLVQLKQMGFSMIIRATGIEKSRETHLDNSWAKREELWAKQAGIEFVNVPMYLTKKSIEELSEAKLHSYKQRIDEALAQADAAQGKVLFHCYHGRDRTGLLSSLYLLKKLGEARMDEIYKYYFLNYPIEGMAYQGSKYDGPGETYKRFARLHER